MRKQRFYFSLCLACLLISACVSKEKYEELEAALAGTQAKLEQKGKAVEELTQKLGELEKNRKKGRQDNSELHVRYLELEKQQQMLSQALAQKEEMIHQADEAKRQLETSLQLQIETREEKIKELEDAAARLD